MPALCQSIDNRRADQGTNLASRIVCVRNYHQHENSFATVLPDASLRRPARRSERRRLNLDADLHESLAGAG